MKTDQLAVPAHALADLRIGHAALGEAAMFAGIITAPGPVVWQTRLLWLR
jgi:hypothetical protein